MKQQFLELISKFKEKKILVIGDSMLDEYIIGDVERISPEAPIPIVFAKEHRHVLGGAANTANNIASLGAKAVLCSIIGKDSAGKKILDLLEKKGIESDCIALEERKTTRKTRIIARQQQMLRVDEEETKEIMPETQKTLMEKIALHAKTVDAIVVSDYAKGLLTPNVSLQLSKIARKNKKMLCVDSKDFKKFRKATLLKPNKKELEAETGKKCASMEGCEKAALLLYKKLKPEALIVTLGAEGMLIVEKNSTQHIKSKAIEVFDVSGAGDTVLSTAALAIASGATVRQAAEIASYAASVVIRKLGTATLNSKELSEEIENAEKSA